MNSEIIFTVNPATGESTLTVVADSAADRDTALLALNSILPFIELVEAAAKRLGETKAV